MPTQFTKQQLIILGVVGFVILFFLLVFLGILPGLRQSGKTETLTFWGIDPSSDWAPTISAFTKLHPGVKINYIQVAESNYQTNLINALAAGTGPDIAVIDNKWLYQRQPILTPAPSTLITSAQMLDLFPQAAVNDFVSNSKVYALPLSMDTLALIYNRSLFNQAGIALPPKTWSAFTSDALRMRILGARGIVRAGTALGGTSASIPDAADIVSLLMMQYGAPMINGGSADFSTAGGNQAVTLYTQFATPGSGYYTWNDSLGNDLSNFENGNVGMIIGYAADLAGTETAAPNLNVGVAPVPQVDPTNAVNFPNYWGIAVTRTAIDPQMAWNFAYFAATDAISAQNYSAATSLPPALRTLIAQDSTSPASPMGVFASQALTARDWTQPNPAAVSGIFDTMIKSVTSGQTSVYNAISQAESAVTALMPIQ